MLAFCHPLPVPSAFRQTPAISARRPRLPRVCAIHSQSSFPSSNTNNTNSKTEKDEEAKPRVRVSHPDDGQAVAAARRVWDTAGIRLDKDDAWGAEDCVVVAWQGGLPVGAGRMVKSEGNARIENVFVLEEMRGRGVGRSLVQSLLGTATRMQGAIYVKATRSELGFYSILGFEAQGNENPDGSRLMVLRVPECAPSAGCVGLHHTSIRVRDIERSLAFYGCLGLFVTDKFLTASGGRACFVEGLGARLELVESGMNGAKEGVTEFGPAGFDRLVFDVTRACTDLDTYMEHLRRRNGGALNVRGPAAKQVVGKHVVSVATIEDVDGLPIEFIRRLPIELPNSLRTRVNW